MVFSSLLFVFLFLCLNLTVYFLAAKTKWRNVVLLVFSLVFYSWGGVQYLALLLGMVFCSWLCARKIEKNDERGWKKTWLIIECMILLGLLAVFKYTGFFLGNLQKLTGFPEVIPEIVLPIGVSFYTFQLISYVVDVYRGEVKAQKAYWKVLLYCSLFHQCIAGPIVRYRTVANEIDNRKITVEDLTEGVRRFCVGLAKKAILANACGAASESLLANTATAPVSGLWLGMLFYTLQIYLDFSAYSDMAIGMGRMVGFHYLENFNYPYIATSVQDFWRRWHISLSSFFRDYVYIPLGGNRKGTLCTIRNMFVVWLLTGFWHGASWNFILWGLYFFVFLFIERLGWGRLLKRIPRMIGWLYTMFVVIIGWVLFYFEDIAQAFNVLAGMFGAGGRELTSMSVRYTFLNHMFLMMFCIVAVTPIGKWFRDLCYKRAQTRGRAACVMYCIDAVTPAVLLILSMFALVGSSYDPFLYFRF